MQAVTSPMSRAFHAHTENRRSPDRHRSRHRLNTGSRIDSEPETAWMKRVQTAPQSGRPDGAVAGWSWERAGGEVVELVRTPIAGLFMAGYQAFSALAMGGVPSAMLSGLKAAEYLLAGAGPVKEMSVPL